MDRHAMEGIELVRAHTEEILEFSKEHKGENLMLIFQEDDLHAIEPFETAYARLRDRLDVPFDKLIEGMRTAKEGSSETAVVLSYIAIKHLDDRGARDPGYESFEVTCGVMSCEMRFLENPRPETKINTIFRGEA